MQDSLPINCRTYGPAKRSGFGKITLQRAALKVPAQIGADALRGRHGTRKSGVIWHFMQEGSASQRPAVGQRLRPFGGVEDQLDVAIPWRPPEDSTRTASAIRVLSMSRTETKTVPLRGTRVPPPSWLLANATSNERSMPITSLVERISGPST